MDREIKRLLKLKRIPGFKLSDKEEFILECWKEQQEHIEAPKVEEKPKKRKYTRKKKTTEDSVKENSDISRSKALYGDSGSKDDNEVIKVQNIVKTADKALNEVEES